MINSETKFAFGRDDSLAGGKTDGMLPSERIEGESLFPPDDAYNLSDDTIARLKLAISENPELKREIQADANEIRMRKQHYAEYTQPEWQTQTKVSPRDFFRDGGLAGQNHIVKKIWDRKWEEDIRLSGQAESNFLESALDVGGGLFVEVMQVVLIDNGQIAQKEAVVGSGLEIGQNQVESILGRFNFEKGNTVFIIHNHYDAYADFTAPISELQSKKGFLTEGSVSSGDVKFADSFFATKTQGKGKVYMIVVNERGLTYSYKAGSAEVRDWENDHD